MLISTSQIKCYDGGCNIIWQKLVGEQLNLFSKVRFLGFVCNCVRLSCAITVESGALLVHGRSLKNER